MHEHDDQATRLRRLVQASHDGAAQNAADNLAQNDSSHAAVAAPAAGAGLQDHHDDKNTDSDHVVDDEVTRSVPTGLVSFGPPRMRPAHAVTARPVAQQRTHPGSTQQRAANVSPVQRPPTARTRAQPVRLGHAIAICSGKGGVGKSNLAVNLAATLAQRGKRVCLLDADLGMANADVLCNLTPRVTLDHVVQGKARLAEALALAPGGFRLIPGASGVTRLAELDQHHRQRLLEQLAALERVVDVLLIDTGAGIGRNVLAFAAAAHSIIVTTTPEPTSMTDAYGMIKSLIAHRPGTVVNLAVNMARDEEEAAAVFVRMNRVVQRFLDHQLSYLGGVRSDEAVRDAVRLRLPFVIAAPDSMAAASVREMAAKIAGRDECEQDHQHREPDHHASSVGRRSSFFARVAGWLGGSSSGG